MNLNAEIERFEEWFEARRRRTWNESRIDTDPVEPRAAWSQGLKHLLLEGWLARASGTSSESETQDLNK